MVAKKKPLCIEGKALDLLKQLIQEGNVYTGKNGNAKSL